MVLPEELTPIMRRIASMGVIGGDVNEVAVHIIRQYIWQNDRSFHDLGACPSLSRCRHD